MKTCKIALVLGAVISSLQAGIIVNYMEDATHLSLVATSDPFLPGEFLIDGFSQGIAGGLNYQIPSPFLGYLGQFPTIIEAFEPGTHTVDYIRNGITESETYNVTLPTDRFDDLFAAALAEQSNMPKALPEGGSTALIMGLGTLACMWKKH